MVQNAIIDLFGFSLKSIKCAFFSGSKLQLIHENNKTQNTKQPGHRQSHTLYSSNIGSIQKLFQVS